MVIPTIHIGLKNISIENIGDIANLKSNIRLSNNKEFVQKISLGPQIVKKLLQEGHIIYGVTTGVGENCGTIVAPELIKEYPNHVVRCHGCALGHLFSSEETRAIIAARLVSLAKGNSGVSMELLESLIGLLRHDILPRIPQEGSVGASGDLCNLSYIGAAICGYRTVQYKGQVMEASEALEKTGQRAYVLENKDTLAILNGTSAMTGVATLAWLRAQRLSHLATRITALTIVVLKGNRYHYDETLFSVKNHSGQQLVAERIRSDLCISNAPQDCSKSKRIQDRYSLRCAPHIIGVLEDVLSFTKKVIEQELNSTNDNPVIDVENGGRVFHGGMFYGGHIAMAMDTLKVQVASVADLMDRQMATLVDTKYSNGLPANLSTTEGSRKAINHGLKALQVAISAWTAEALKMCMPATVFSRSTESHNQDKVSMGTIAARDCRRIIELTEQVVAGMLIALRQALFIRMKQGEVLNVSKHVESLLELVKKNVQEFHEDVFLEPILRNVMETIKNLDFAIY